MTTEPEFAGEESNGQGQDEVSEVEMSSSVSDPLVDDSGLSSEAPESEAFESEASESEASESEASESEASESEASESEASESEAMPNPAVQADGGDGLAKDQAAGTGTALASTNANSGSRFVLPNAKEGESYRLENVKAKIFGEEADDVLNFYFTGLEGTGLALLEVDDVIEGIPELPDGGDSSVSLSVFYHLKTRPNAKPLYREGSLIVNPDPTKLWKNIPSREAEVTYWKPDDASEFIEVEHGYLTVASKRGRSHAHEGTCRDDDFRIRYFEESAWWLSIVADGAGGSKFSRKGSEIAVETGMQQFEMLIPKLASDEISRLINGYADGDQAVGEKLRAELINVLVRNVGYEAFRKIHEHAHAQQHSAREYHTTFLLTAWKRMEGGKWFVCAFCVGDGGLALHTSRGINSMNSADEGEFAGQTKFLTTNSVWEDAEELKGRVRFHVVDDLKGIYSMSDGITDPKFETPHNFENSEDKWSQFLRDLNANVFEVASSDPPDVRLLNWMNFWSPGNHDDRTLSIFHPRESGNV